VRGDLRLSLLIDFNFKSTFSRPLFPEVLIQFLNTQVLEVFAFFLGFLIV
jgi:hypothetical protein